VGPRIAASASRRFCPCPVTPSLPPSPLVEFLFTFTPASAAPAPGRTFTAAYPPRPFRPFTLVPSSAGADHKKTPAATRGGAGVLGWRKPMPHARFGHPMPSAMPLSAASARGRGHLSSVSAPHCCFPAGAVSGSQLAAVAVRHRRRPPDPSAPALAGILLDSAEMCVRLPSGLRVSLPGIRRPCLRAGGPDVTSTCLQMV
jgi:hypothetical protein